MLPICSSSTQLQNISFCFVNYPIFVKENDFRTSAGAEPEEEWETVATQHLVLLRSLE